MCKLRNVGRINYNDVVLLKQRFCLFEYLYCEFGPAAVEFVDKDDGSVGYLGKIGLNEFVIFASKFFLIFVLFEKIGSAEFFNDTIDVTAISDKGSGRFYGANDPLAEILPPPLTLCSSAALAMEANMGKIGFSKWSSSHALK